VAGADDLMSMLRGVQDLKGGQPSSGPDFFGFHDWKEVQEFAKSREGEHLMTFVNLVDSRSEKQLMWALNRSVEPEKADIVISTTHKAKGREWPSVQLTDDFVKVDPKTKQVSAEELRLLYVAMTRAQKELELPETIQKFLKQPYTAQTPTKPVVAASQPIWTTPTQRQQPVDKPLAQSSKHAPERPGFFSRLFNAS
jgi:ATP-dependent exoDNAse (exonuclease V) beta subunit